MAYSWKSDFSHTIYQRGEEYYKLDKILSFEMTDSDTAEAKIAGSEDEPYRVTVRKTKNGTIRYTCSCPYSLNCKHEVALCFELEKRGFFCDSEISSLIKKINVISTNKIEENLQPLSEFIPDDNKYHYYDIKTITRRLFVSKENYEKATTLVNENIVSLKSASSFPDKPDEYFFQFTVNEPDVSGNLNSYSVKTTVSPFSVTGAQCFVPGCNNHFSSYNYIGGKTISLCPHNIAALILTGNWLNKENPGDETDSNGDKLFSLYNNETKNKTRQNRENSDPDLIPENKTVWHFEPYLEHHDNSLFVGFKGGSEKVYFIKDLIPFFENYNNKQQFEFSKTCTIDFSNAKFDEQSQKYLDFAARIIDNEIALRKMQKQSYMGYGNTENITNGFYLYGQRLDDFFDLAVNTYIPNKQVSSYVPLKNKETFFGYKDLKIELEITPEFNEKKQISKITCTGQNSGLIPGANHQYFIQDENCYRISNDLSEKLKQLSQLTKYGNIINFSIGRKKISFFMNNILPWLKTFCNVTENNMDQIAELIIPDPTFSFFLDSNGKEILCTAQVSYNQNEHNLLDRLFGAEKEDQRDYEVEDRVIELLLNYFEKDEDRKILICSNDDIVFDFLHSGIFDLMNAGEVKGTEAFKRIKVRDHIKAKIGISLQSSLLDLNIEADEITTAELLSILSGMRKKKKYIRLNSGDFISTKNETLEELNQILESLNISEKEFLKEKIQIPQYRALYLDHMLENCSSMYTERDKTFRTLINEFKTLDNSDFEVPESLKPIMRNYQIHGYKWLRTLKEAHFSGILADEMGLGKTLQTISLLLDSKEHNENGTSLIVCPSSLIYNWGHEFSQFAPSLSYKIISGSASERKQFIADYKNYDVLITSYDLLKRDFTEYEDKTFFYQIIDEAQYIKNTTTSAAKSVKTIQAEHRLALTGTPIENRLSELWSIFDFLMPGYLFSANDFRTNFEIPIVKNSDEEKSRKLQQMVSPFILRRLKKDVLKDLPDKIEEIYFSQMDEDQKKLYDAQALKLVKKLTQTDEKTFSKSKIQILAELTKIRQICCDPSLAFDNYNGSSAKRESCMELINQGIQGEHKMLLFSQFTSMLDLLKKDLNSKGIPFYEITGETDKKTRYELAKKFNADDTPVFLISLKAGGTGLNLPGADIVIHYDPWWNIAVENQATDRAHRIGQTRDVTVYKLIAKDTIEEKIVELQEMKKNLSDQILSGENGTLGSLSREDLLDLIN